MMNQCFYMFLAMDSYGFMMIHAVAGIVEQVPKNGDAW